MDTPQEIIFKIYYLLKERPYSIYQLHQKLSSYHISKRTVYRYINRLEKSLDVSKDFLEVELEGKNKKTFFIKEINKQLNITQSEWLNYLNNNFIFQSNYDFTEEDQQLYDKINSLIKKNAPLKSQLFSLLHDSNKFYEASHFGEIILNKKLKKNIIKFLFYYSNDCIICINKYSNSVIDNCDIPNLHEPLMPLKIWYHRGNYSFSFYALNEQKVFSLEIDMIDDIVYLKKNNLKLKNKFNIQNSYTFGYHPPIIDGVFDIVLIFPPTPGEHIINRFWHSSQKFKKRKDGFIEFKLTCEINIELLGWISMWLDNVKIKSPIVLKNIFKERLITMQQICNNKINPINNG